MASSSSSVLVAPSRALQLAASAKLVAVLGARTDANRSRPAFYVAEFLSNDGVEIIPLPVRPEEGTFPGGAKPLLGGLSALSSLPKRVDVLCCFRRPEDLPSADEVIAARPRVLWLQSGIRNPALEEAVARSGGGGGDANSGAAADNDKILVVADRCMKLDRAAAKASRM